MTDPQAVGEVKRIALRICEACDGATSPQIMAALGLVLTGMFVGQPRKDLDFFIEQLRRAVTQEDDARLQ